MLRSFEEFWQPTGRLADQRIDAYPAKIEALAV